VYPGAFVNLAVFTNVFPNAFQPVEGFLMEVWAKP
jgi:hypothetical protein